MRLFHCAALGAARGKLIETENGWSDELITPGQSGASKLISPRDPIAAPAGILQARLTCRIGTKRDALRAVESAPKNLF
jgi:hypothetical protein